MRCNIYVLFACFVLLACRATHPVDSLLFLQHRAGNRQFRNRGVLVTSQAGCLCFWSITGQTHSYGEWEWGEWWIQGMSFRKKTKKTYRSHSMREVNALHCTPSWQTAVSFNYPPVRWIYKQPEQWQSGWTVDLASRRYHSWQPTSMSLSRSHLCLVVWDSCTVTAAYACMSEWACVHLCVCVWVCV